MSLLRNMKETDQEKTEETLSDGGCSNLRQNQTETYLRIRLKASITMEAVVVLPVFTGFLIFLLFCFRVMQVQIGMQQALAYTARVTAASVREESERVSPAKTRLLLFRRIRREKVPCQYIDRGQEGISLRYLDLQGEEISLHVSYRMTVPAGFFGKLTYPVEQEAAARKWTGRQIGDEDGKHDTYVYVTKTGTVYHRNRDCAYLNLSIRSVHAEEIKNLRNKNGEKYKACGSCKKRGDEVCYITDYGNCYHRNLSCSGLKRTIYVLSLKQVGDRHGCNKCTGG